MFAGRSVTAGVVRLCQHRKRTCALCFCELYCLLLSGLLTKPRKNVESIFIVLLRHSRFGGTYVMQGKKALADDKDIIVHCPLRKCDNISFDDGKVRLKKAKNRRPLVEDSITRY